MASTTRAPFRLRPPELPDGLVVRDRLLDQLRQRFDRRLTVVRAGPGFGKTTLLAHAVIENALDPVGVDAWMQLFEQDRRPDHLVSGLAASLADVGLASSEPSAEPPVDEVIEWMWAVAPRPVALVLDDVHLLDGSPSMDLLADLCERLPANAHLVLGTRTPSALPIRLLQARGQAVVLDESDLAFTRRRTIDVRRASDTSPSTTTTRCPSWPALAVLMSTVGQVASIDFLWEAVLGSVPTRSPTSARAPRRVRPHRRRAGGRRRRPTLDGRHPRRGPAAHRDTRRRPPLPRPVARSVGRLGAARRARSTR